MKKNTERFSDRVENYIKYRPTYPQEFIDYLYSNIGFSKDSIIADIGSGTGILTSQLLKKGSYVIGVEPNKEMRNASETFLKEYDKYISVDGTAEKTKIESLYVDFIICAQAFHWFDRNFCKKEFQRILKPTGKTVLVWNKRIVNKTGFSAEYEDLVAKYANDYNEVNHQLVDEAEFKMFFKDSAYSFISFGNKQSFDLDGIKCRLLSSSYSPMPGEKNFEILNKGLELIFNRYEIKGVVPFEYKTEVYIGEV